MAERTDAGDEVHLVVPTTPDLLRLVRVVASGLASRLGFPIDAVEDVRLAVDELCWTVISPVQATSSATSWLAVRFVIHEGAFSVEARLQAGGGAAEEDDLVLTALSERILSTLVDDYSVLPATDGAGAGFRMRTKQS